MSKEKGLSRSEYNRRYYELNKERLSRQRKRKYQLDRKYAERCKKLSRESYRRRVGSTGNVDRTVVQVGDQYYYTSGHFQDLVGRKSATIRTIQRNGIIPEVSVVNKSGWRLYSEKQKDLIVELFNAYDSGKIKTLKEYTPYLREHWND